MAVKVTKSRIDGVEVEDSSSDRLVFEVDAVERRMKAWTVLNTPSGYVELYAADARELAQALLDWADA